MNGHYLIARQAGVVVRCIPELDKLIRRSIEYVQSATKRPDQYISSTILGERGNGIFAETCCIVGVVSVMQHSAAGRIPLAQAAVCADPKDTATVLIN